LATPYFQMRLERVSSTQDVARAKLEDLPLLVLAQGQTEGRGRSGSEWLTADRALAASLAFHHDSDEDRPLSLMAGVAAVRATHRTRLKWPNDVLLGDGSKVGGILVERSGDVTVVGLGLNLWWPAPPDGVSALFELDPGEDRYAEIGGLWGAELMELIDGSGWPADAYREVCMTIGRDITWEPHGAGKAVDVADDGALVVDSRDGETMALHSGAVLHVRA
jgi:BirA family biotin operon repressor/biotin-[acetyl-CoA-carboxylase] ligase